MLPHSSKHALRVANGCAIVKRLPPYLAIDLRIAEKVKRPPVWRFRRRQSGILPHRNCRPTCDWNLIDPSRSARINREIDKPSIVGPRRHAVLIAIRHQLSGGAALRRDYVNLSLSARVPFECDLPAVRRPLRITDRDPPPSNNRTAFAPWRRTPRFRRFPTECSEIRCGGRPGNTARRCPAAGNRSAT